MFHTTIFLSTLSINTYKLTSYAVLRYGVVVTDQYRSKTRDIQPWNVEFNQGRQKHDRYTLSLSHINRCYRIGLIHFVMNKILNETPPSRINLPAQKVIIGCHSSIP